MFNLYSLGCESDMILSVMTLTFQSIINVLYFFQFRGNRYIVYTPPPTLKILFVGGGALKNDVTEMIHLLTFNQQSNNVLYFSF